MRKTMTVEIFFLGLDQVGASIGMAIAQAEIQQEILRVGYDPDPRLARRAQELEAIDRLVGHPRSAPKSADLVIIDTPVVDIREYLKLLSKTLKPDGVIIDTSHLKAAPMAWAADILPEQHHYIGATPVVGPHVLASELVDLNAPRADLFHGGFFAFAVPTSIPEAAVRLASSLAVSVGATPFFVDAAESDGVNAITHDLPSILGAVLMHLAKRSPSWREISRLAGAPFAAGTEVISHPSPDIYAATLALNRDNIMMRIDTLIDELHILRTALADEEGKAIKRYIEDAVVARESWLAEREKGEWDTQDHLSPLDSGRGGLLSTLLGIKQRKPRAED
jgi:prephenate dehydrogenase